MKCPEPYLSWRVDLTGLEGTWTWGWLKLLAGRGSNRQQGSSKLRTVGLRDCPLHGWPDEMKTVITNRDLSVPWAALR